MVKLNDRLSAILWKYAQQNEIDEKELGKKQRQKTMALKNKQYDDLTAHVRQVRYRTAPIPYRAGTVPQYCSLLKTLLSNEITE